MKPHSMCMQVQTNANQALCYISVWLLYVDLHFSPKAEELQTQEECNEVKTNKRKKGREEKPALHCDSKRAAVIELDLRGFKKRQKKTLSAPDLPLQSIPPSPMPAFYSSNQGTALNWAPQNNFVLKFITALSQVITSLHAADLSSW